MGKQRSCRKCQQVRWETSLDQTIQTPRPWRPRIWQGAMASAPRRMGARDYEIACKIGTVSLLVRFQESLSGIPLEDVDHGPRSFACTVRACYRACRGRDRRARDFGPPCVEDCGSAVPWRPAAGGFSRSVSQRRRDGRLLGGRRVWKVSCTISASPWAADPGRVSRGACCCRSARTPCRASFDSIPYRHPQPPAPPWAAPLSIRRR